MRNKDLISEEFFNQHPFKVYIDDEQNIHVCWKGQERKISYYKRNTCNYISFSYWSNENKRFESISLQVLVYLWFKGDIPAGMEVDHVDDNPLNNLPENLHLLSHKANIWKAIWKKKGFCMSAKRLSKSVPEEAYVEMRNSLLNQVLSVAEEYIDEGTEDALGRIQSITGLCGMIMTEAKERNCEEIVLRCVEVNEKINKDWLDKNGEVK